MILLVKSDLEVNHPTIDLSQLVVQIRTFQIQIFSLIIILVIDLLTLVRHHQILQCELKVKFNQKGASWKCGFLYPLPLYDIIVGHYDFISSFWVVKKSDLIVWASLSEYATVERVLIRTNAVTWLFFLRILFFDLVLLIEYWNRSIRSGSIRFWILPLGAPRLHR